MNLALFLLLLYFFLQLLGEYLDWSETKVKLAIFIIALAVSLPNIVFMVIDWWRSPHSKMALLVLHTFRPVLRGEISRLFRWLKRLGINLACDELNYLPITKTSAEPFEFYMTKECTIETETEDNGRVEWNGGPIHEEAHDWDLSRTFSWYTKWTFCVAQYVDGVLHVHQLENSRKLIALDDDLEYGEFVAHPLFKSSLTKSARYTVDASRAELLLSRLRKIYCVEMPILTDFDYRREWLYFHAGSILDHLNGELVLIKSQGEFIAIGSPRYNIFK